MRPSSMDKGCRHLPVPTKTTIGGSPHYQTDPMKDGINVGRHQAIGSHASDIGHSLRGTMRWSSDCTEITKTVQEFNQDCPSYTCCGKVLPLAVYNGCPTTQREINSRALRQTTRTFESRSYTADYEALHQTSRTFESLSYTDDYEALRQRPRAFESHSYTDDYEALRQRSRAFESRSYTDDYEALRQRSRTFESLSYTDNYEAAEHILIEGEDCINRTVYEKVDQERFQMQDDVNTQKMEYKSEDYGELSIEINEELHIVDGEGYDGYEEDYAVYCGDGDNDVYCGDEDDYL